MIKSFADKNTEALWNGQKPRRLPPEIIRTAERKLAQINAATNASELRVPPRNRLGKLKGDREGQHSIRINDQWRICFNWIEGNAHNVEITDYH